MSQGIVLNYEYIGSHIKDYIEADNLFSTFEVEDIESIMKFANLTPDEFNSLLAQSHSVISARELYACTRNANVSINNLQDAVSTLKSVQKYMKMRVFEGIIVFLEQLQKDQSITAHKIEKLQADLIRIQKEKENVEKEMQTLHSQLKAKEGNDLPKEFLSKISELKNSEDFNQIYKFFDEISEKGNQKMMQKACEEELWKKQNGFYGTNVLHFASSKGNLRLVKSLIECGCDKEINSRYGGTALFWASREGHLPVVQYLISVGANKEAKDKYGDTPLIYASYYGKLEVVKYLISVGANKEAKNNEGKTALDCSKGAVREYLLSIARK
ncbi:ankyrin repeat protein, putative [Trichomonas vaginalis G3]|uniref:Ankyrin repeat protein, putative n=1 Tax=Trichomonas vaginalis (strain ATCC PRA-98 / G3) TaxID=412133 RepID=A2H593_TRIV3|nr:protein ubiquitination [Trichomonas vaginalis G3]EAX75424.1 ankyrin repeat protein, putative [Trichomonas vaginalis G3]KAI5483676.1 protein ubiquitination [Trichomonas vaginalis G3]|eukprot:XP_001288354.1 ankyrin repeat protein [Trichomonas vaginalis G3]